MTHVEHIEEPFVRATVLVPDEFIGAVMEVCQERRGTFITMEYITLSGPGWSMTCPWRRSSWTSLTA